MPRADPGGARGPRGEPGGGGGGARCGEAARGQRRRSNGNEGEVRGRCVGGAGVLGRARGSARGDAANK